MHTISSTSALHLLNQRYTNRCRGGYLLATTRVAERAAQDETQDQQAPRTRVKKNKTKRRSVAWSKVCTYGILYRAGIIYSVPVGALPYAVIGDSYGFVFVFWLKVVFHGFLRTHMRARRVYGVLRKIL